MSGRVRDSKSSNIERVYLPLEKYRYYGRSVDDLVDCSNDIPRRVFFTVSSHCLRLSLFSSSSWRYSPLRATTSNFDFLYTCRSNRPGLSFVAPSQLSREREATDLFPSQCLIANNLQTLDLFGRKFFSVRVETWIFFFFKFPLDVWKVHELFHIFWIFSWARKKCWIQIF